MMMATKLPRGDAFALADAHFGECQIVAEFIDKSVRTRVNTAAELNLSNEHPLGLLLRVVAWLRSTVKLNHPADWQAAASAARSLFEIAVDTTLLHEDRKTYPLAKLLAWESSAKLKHAVDVCAYVSENPGKVVRELDLLQEFISRQGPRIEAERAQFWPPRPGKKTEHPLRWTGKSLRDDAQAADHLSRRGFVEFYRLRYPRICWSVHGSGLAGVADVSEGSFPVVMALTLHEVAEFAVIAAEMTCRYVGCWNATLKREFAELAQRRARTRAILFLTHPDRS